MTREEFLEWKSHPVTKEVFNQLRLRCSEVASHLCSAAGIDSLDDRRLVGKFEAYNEMLYIQLEDEESDDN